MIGVLLVSVSTDTIEDNLGRPGWKRLKRGLGYRRLVILVLAFSGFAMDRALPEDHAGDSAVTEGYDDSHLHENAYTETKAMSEAFNKMMGRMRVLDDSRQEFVSNVSHELKTPLTSMKVLADSLLTQEEVPPNCTRNLWAILSEEIERENKIITDLLSLVKMDKTANTLNIKSENINELLELILKRLRPIAATGILNWSWRAFGR